MNTPTHKRAYYYLVTNAKKKITVQICQLAPFIREMGMESEYNKLSYNMRNSEDEKATSGIYVFRRISENPYPRIRMMLNGEIEITKNLFTVNKSGFVKECTEKTVVPRGTRIPVAKHRTAMSLSR